MIKIKKSAGDYLIYIVNGTEEFRIVQLADNIFVVRKFTNLKMYWWEKNMYDWSSLSTHDTIEDARKYIEDYDKYPINH